MSPDPSASLIGDYAATGSAEAFGELMRRHAGLVFAVALRITGNASDAEEVSQDCFWTMARNAARLKPPLVPWLHRVATSRAINLVRRRNTARWRRQQYADVPAPEPEQPWRQLWPMVDEALLELPTDQRDLLIRHFLEGSSQGEMATTTGVSQSTMSRRIEDALAGLRKVLARRGAAPAILLTAASLATLRAGEAPATLTAQLGRLALAGKPATAAATTSLAIKGWLVTVTLAALAVTAALVVARNRPAPSAAATPAPAPTIAVAPSAPPSAILPGLRLWLRADRGVEMDGGAAVVAWHDDDHRIVARAPSPGQRPQSATLAGGITALRFDGIDDALTFPLAINGWNEFATVIVAAVREERTLPANTQQALWATLTWDETADNGGTVLCLRQGGVLAAIGTGPSGTPGRPPVGDAELFVAHPTAPGSQLHAIALLRRPGSVEIWRDGAKLATFPHDQRPITASEDLAHIGRGTGETWIAKPYSGGRIWHKYVGFSYAPVDVAEVMVSDQAPSAAELQRVFAAIATHWHLATPADH